LAHKNLIKQIGVGLLTVNLSFGMALHPKAADNSVFTPPAGQPVHYNWGTGGPPGMPVDNFNADFDQSGQYSGDYFVQTQADDGVKVEADGQMLINRWSPSAGNVDRALWTGVSNGQHTVKTHYYEGTGNAGVFSDIVPFNSWLAYYYGNESLSGLPTAAKVIQPTGSLQKLSENNGLGSPAIGVPTDHFSARYVTAKHIAAGDYILRAKADDGVRVYVDGNLVLDRWGPGTSQEDAAKIHIADRTDAPAGQQDAHWVEVQYYEGAGNSNLEFFLEPFQTAIDNSWVAEYYSNMNLSGNPVVTGGANSINQISDINFNWQLGSPNSSIPADKFSARFTKKVNLEAGTYQFNAAADDGVRVLVDNQPVIDSWKASAGEGRTGKTVLSKGTHTITVEYYEDQGGASLSFNYFPIVQAPTQVGGTVHYNWGSGSPAGMPADHFTADFDQSGKYSGDYFVQTQADDGVQVEADGNKLIDRWTPSAGTVDRALWTGVTSGQHTVMTHYYEDTGNAGVFSDIVPFDSWLAYYYPNEGMSGIPTAAKVIQPSGTLQKLTENNGLGSPASGVPADHFSARYVTAKHIAAGDYIIHAKADDGVRVYVDGQLVLNRWGPGTFQEDQTKVHIEDRTDAPAGQQDAHWIEVQYYEGDGNSQLEMYMEPFQTAIDNSWVAEYYPNMTLSGNPIMAGGSSAVSKINDINFNWQLGSPTSSIPADHFSARFTKKVSLDGGLYQFSTMADDGVRVLVDNQPVIDSWGDSAGTLRTGKVALDKGTHTITVEYYENAGGASLSFSYTPYAQLPTQVGGTVHYNWGSGSPAGMPADHFTANFDQSGQYASGDYFIQTLADDGVRVLIDGQPLIDRWSNSAGDTTQALWMGVAGGQHSVMTNYYEDAGGAAVFSDVVPFDSWLAYYYPNESLSGLPTAAKVIQPTGDLKKLSEDNGTGSPASGIPADHFSARYVTAKHIAAGDYIIRSKADDGVRVYVDGKLVQDHWDTGTLQENATKIHIDDQVNAASGQKDVHWVQVEYKEITGGSNVNVSLEAFKTAIANTWVGEFYPNTTLSGNPIIVGGSNSTNPISILKFDWGAGSPTASIPLDHFSARFTKQVSMDAGTYAFTAKADDGVRVFLDGQPVMDYWQNTDVNAVKKSAIYVTGGKHTIVVEYREDTGGALVNLDYQQISPNKVFYAYGNQIHYNWGTTGPDGFSADNFDAVFDQAQTFNNGDYFIQTDADDNVKVTVDGQTKIDQGTDPAGTIEKALLLNMTAGEHQVTTNYHENVADSYVNSDIVPFDSWLAYYYPNTSLSGSPAAVKTIAPTGNYKALSENNGTNSPVQGIIPADNFSAKYVTAKRLAAGDYVLRASADDGIKVYIDGNLVLNHWSANDGKEDAVKVSIQDQNTQNSDEKNVHWIEVQYYESSGQSNLNVSLQPLTDVTNTDQWVGYVYPSKDLTGNPVILGGVGAQTTITDLNFDWGTGSPQALIPTDGFSAKFTKSAYFNTGIYQINTHSDDGIRVYVDGDLKIDSWTDAVSDHSTSVVMGAGFHTITVEYYENTGGAALKVDIVNTTSQNAKLVSSFYLPVYRSFAELSDYTKHLTYYNPSYTRYAELGYGDLVYLVSTNQYGAQVVLRDGRTGWVQKDYLVDNLNNDLWLVKDARPLYSQASTGSTILGQVSSQSKVHVIQRVSTTGSSKTDWYYIQTADGLKGWIWGATASSPDQGYDLIKLEFDKIGTVTNQISIFTPLDTQSSVTADQINRFIDYKTAGRKSVMTGMGWAYLQAQQESGLNAVYLLAHSGLESNWGTSLITSTKFNFYGIGAVDAAPLFSAYDYSSPAGGIIEGADWISYYYVKRSWDTDTKLPFYQPTLDNMRWDNSYHQYAADEAWAVKIESLAQEFYNFINK
jgi:beta-N-acetylglucosaminidase/single-stranded DNA-binding protein